jgi:uncharacterized protein
MIRFLDVHLKDGLDVNYDPVLHYYTMGAEEWRSTATWPPHGTTWKGWYFDKGGTLSEHPVQDLEGQDQFEVDFEATTGRQNRWWELSGILNESVAYPDRSMAAAHMLTYTSPILEFGGGDHGASTGTVVCEIQRARWRLFRLPGRCTPRWAE